MKPIIHESIKAPQAKIVAGFENQLMPNYGFTDDQIRRYRRIY